MERPGPQLRGVLGDGVSHLAFGGGRRGLMLVRMNARPGEGMLDLRRKLKLFRRKRCGRSRSPTGGLGGVIPGMDELERMVAPQMSAPIGTCSKLTIATTRYEQGKPGDSLLGRAQGILIGEGGEKVLQDRENIGGVLRK